jgi:putative DNA primase/helicase
VSDPGQSLGETGKVQIDVPVLRALRDAGVAEADARELARLDALGTLVPANVVALIQQGEPSDTLRHVLSLEAQAAFARAAEALLPEIARTALEYLRRGWAPIPVPRGQKAPKGKAWQTLRLSPAEVRAQFGDGQEHNAGVLLGEPSGCLVDVDLDSPEAIALAGGFLPPTPAVFGRESKPGSHWLYVAAPSETLPQTTRYQDTGTGAARTCLVELRSTGAQTIFPGSVHPSGEAIVWERDAGSASMDGRRLAAAVGRLATASLLARHWPGEGARHDCALALGAVLARGGWWADEIATFVARVARAAGDAEADDRAQATASSVEGVRRGKKVTGWKTLADLLGSRTCDRVRVWLGLDAEPESPPPSPTPPPPYDFEGHPLLEAMERAAGIEDPPPGPPPQSNSQAVLYEPSDVGNAERLVARFGRDLRYCAPWRSWLLWDGRRWQRDEEGAILRFAIRTVRAIRAEARATEYDDRAGKLRKWAADSQSEAKLRALLTIAQALPGVPVRPDELDACPHLLNCPDGTVDLRTGLKYAHRRGDLLTKLAATSGDMDAPAPLFEQFLSRIVPDETVRCYLQRMAGQTLVGDETERVLAVLYGPGRNGKSTLVEALLAALGPDYARVAPPETLLERRDGAIPNDLAMLKGVRLVAVSETDQDQHLAEALVKRITGGDTISARFMRGEWFDFKPQFTPWLATNSRPTVRGDDQGIWDRIKLREELPGILGWALRGCVEWRIRGLSEPEPVRSATEAYREAMDVVGRFLEEACELNPQAQTPARVLFAAFQTWCADTGETSRSQRWLGLRLTDRGFASLHTKAGNAWIGLAEKKP